MILISFALLLNVRFTVHKHMHRKAYIQQLTNYAKCWPLNAKMQGLWTTQLPRMLLNIKKQLHSDGILYVYSIFRFN